MKRHALISLVMVASSAFAAQPPSMLDFSNNETLTVKLSSVDINRLVVRDDKITNVVCPSGFCTLPMGQGAAGSAIPLDKSGAALIALNVEEPFTFYVSTLKGKNFGVFVTPLRIPAVTTEFVSSERDTSAAFTFEASSPYQEMLVEVMKSMMRFQDTQTVPEGFVYTKIEEKKRKPAELDVIPRHVFSGHLFSGLIYEVKNNAPSDIKLNNTRFYVNGLRALSLDKKVLRAGESTLMYQIVSGEWM